ASTIPALAVASSCGLVTDVPHHERGQHVRADTFECERGFADCNGDPDDGCEADLRTDAHCGSCGARCTNGNCTHGVCACDDTFEDCDRDPSNGCEVDLAHDAANCGACGRDCRPGSCVDRQCLPGMLVSLAGDFQLVPPTLIFTDWYDIFT